MRTQAGLVTLSNITKNRLQIKIDKVGQVILIKETMHRENCSPKRVQKKKQKTNFLLNVKPMINSNAMIAGNFDILLSPIDRPFEQKLNTGTLAVNDILN